MNLVLPKTTLLALDPGETTGVVEVFNGELIRAYTVSYDKIFDSVADEGEPTGRWAHEYPLWVIEDFRVYPWANLGFDPVRTARLIGVLQVAAQRGNVKVEYQMAGLAKQMVRSDLLRQLGWFHRLKGTHAKDAARHAVCYMLRQLAEEGRKV